jgi:myo-inositol-1(or 4)-monophosphatase
MTSAKDMKDFLAAVDEAAMASGSLIREGWRQGKQIQFKSPVDLVTSIDRRSEECIVNILQKRFPNHSILAEEETTIAGFQSNHRWIVDPLDGTTNFAHSYPHFCISIALEREGVIILGVVYDPLREETFKAVRGQGSFLNDIPIQPSKVSEVNQALLATGFPYDRREKASFYLAFLKAFLISSQGIRRNGSAALDLCYVACGRLDGYWEFGLHSWDTAAASLIVKEAGGVISDFEGNAFSIWGQETLGSNGLIHTEMRHIIREVKYIDSPKVD